MTSSDEHNPYRRDLTGTSRRRTMLMVIAGLLLAGVGVALHLMGVLPAS
jgi:hypothetical protein